MRLTLLLALVMLFPVPARAIAEWTVMSYFDADCDLERAMVRNLRQAIAVGSTEQVNLVFLADRAAPVADDQRECFSDEGVGGLEDWTGAKLLLAKKGELHEVADWGLVNLGDPKTLERFIAEVAKQFPAKRYMLILSDHGAAWPGVCLDTSAGDDLLTLPELSGALAASRAALGGKLEVIGFDACLMATAEVASEVAPHAKVLLASEEVEPADGWQYEASMAKLVEEPTMDGAALARRIAADYQAQFDGSDEDVMRRRGLGITLSAVSLDRWPAVEAALDALGTELRRFAGDTDGWRDIARVRSETEGYGGGVPGEPQSGMFDLVHATGQLATSDDPGVAKAAADAKAAATAAILTAVYGEARPQAAGISVFWPGEQASFTALGAEYPALALSRGRKWFPFLQQYVGADAKDAEAPPISDVHAEPDVAKAGVPISLTSTSTAQDVADAAFALAVLDGDTRVLLGQIPTALGEGGKLAEKWRGDWFHVRSGDARSLAAVSGFETVDQATGRFLAMVPAQAKREKRTAWFDVTLYFYLDMDPEKATGRLVYAYTNSDDGRRQIQLVRGDQVRPVFLKLDASGTASRQPLESRSAVLTLTGPDALTLELAPVTKGEYLAGFLLTDLAGNVRSEFAPVRLE